MGFWETGEDTKYQKIGEILGASKEGNGVVFRCSKGVLRIKVITPRCVRITCNRDKNFLNIPSFAVVNEPVHEDFTMEQKDDVVILNTGVMLINIYKQQAKIVIYDYQGRIISDDAGSGFCWTKDAVKCTKNMRGEEHFYGLGEKTGFLDKRGRKYTMWCTDEHTHTPLKDPLYKSIPFLITFNPQCAYGIFVDSTCRIEFDLGDESSESYSFEVYDSEMDYYFIYGPGIKDVLIGYAGLTGKMHMPPKWALGYQQCRWSYYPEEVVTNLADTFRKKDIPCDVIYLDIDYMNEYRVFTWNLSRFPDPARMLKALREQGFKVVTIVDPGVKKDPEFSVYIEGVRKDLFCKQLTGEVYHGKVWPGDSAYPDFTKEETRRWWGEKHTELLEAGIAGIWNDMNEPSDFSPDTQGDRKLLTVPNDVMMDNDGYPRTFARYHNSYGFNMCKATYNGLESIKPDERPFIVTRSAYAGIQRYSAVWTGDNHSWWEHIAASMPMHMNIGMSGVPFVGGDVGGFQDNATPELFVRWMQLGAFTPFFRAHSAISTKHHEPWAFGEEVEEICRKYIKLRYALLTYSYNEFYKASQTGLPIMRPLVLEYPDDEDVHNLSDQFLYGENIMVAPIYRPSTCKRCVYIPEGIWYNYWTGEKYTGRTYILVDALLDTLPLFIKSGSIIPVGAPVNYVGEKTDSTLTLEVYPGKDISYSLYEDDGISNRYKEGEYCITSFEIKESEKGFVFGITPRIKGYNTGREKYLLKFKAACKEPLAVCCRDSMSYSYDKQQGVLAIEVEDTGNEQTITVDFNY